MPSSNSMPVSSARPGGNDARRRRVVLALGLILAAGLALRAFGLGHLPPGMWSDEALNANDAWRAVHGGGLRLVYPDVFPREPMFETLLVLATRLAGRPSILALRAVPVIIGVLTLLLLYLALRREAGQAVALTAAGVLAGLRWHVLMSRIVLRTIILPPWMILIVWAALACRRRPTAARAALLGALVGGGFYTYLAWYFMAPLVAGLIVWVGWPGAGRGQGDAQDDGQERVARRAAAPWISALAALVAALVFAPLGLHYLSRPSDILARPGAVSVFKDGLGPGLREIAQNAFEAVLMFHWFGDHVPVQNVPRAAALDPIQGLFFIWGLALCVAQAWRRRPLPWILLGWIACGMATTIFAYTDSPNFLRSLVMTPAVATVVAIGLVDAARRAEGRRLSSEAARRAGAAPLPLSAILIAVALAASAIVSGWRLERWSRLPIVWAKNQADLVAMGQEARALAAPDVAIFIPAPMMVEDARQLHYQLLGLSGIYPYSDDRVLAPWPPTPEAAGRPRPARRVVFYPMGFPMLDYARQAGLAARLIWQPTGPPQARVIEGAIAFPEPPQKQ
jgi:hypothetical protein